MEIKSKFLESLADISIKEFQIVFTLLVIGMLLRDRFEFFLFIFGIIISFLLLTSSIILYYNGSIRGDE